MKILHIIISNFYVEGAGYQENILTRKHKELGNDVSIISKSTYYDHNKEAIHREPGIYINNDGISVTILPDNKNKKWSKYSRGRLYFMDRVVDNLNATIEKENPDIIFEHGLSVADTIDIISYVKKHPNVKLYIDQHGDYYNTPLKGANIIDTILLNYRHKCYHRRITKRGIPYVNYFWGTTPWRVDYLRSVYKVPSNKSGLLIMGGDEEYIDWTNRDRIRIKNRMKIGLSENDFVIITGGKIDKTKNIHLLIEAISKLDIPNIKLLVFGKPTDDMKQIMEDLSNHYINLGWLDSNAVYPWFLTSDLAVFPGTHSVLWEQAAACGLPMLCKYWSGMQHVNVSGNSRFFNGESVECIKKAIAEIIQDNNVYSNMLQEAIKVHESFYYINIAKKSIEK